MEPSFPIDLPQLYPEANPKAMELMINLLKYDPLSRPTAAMALNFPYMKSMPKYKKSSSTKVNNAAEKMNAFIASSLKEFEFENRKLPIEDLRSELLREVLQYNKSDRKLKTYFNSLENRENRISNEVMAAKSAENEKQRISNAMDINESNVTTNLNSKTQKEVLQSEFIETENQENINRNKSKFFGIECISGDYSVQDVQKSDEHRRKRVSNNQYDPMVGDKRNNNFVENFNSSQSNGIISGCIIN